jgi:hypothetical protein
MLEGKGSGNPGVSALQMIEKVALQMAVVNALGTSVIRFFWPAWFSCQRNSRVYRRWRHIFGYVFNIQHGCHRTKFLRTYTSSNALGVYDSPSLSAYSNGVYSTPKTFAFAKGAGIFGEAGPEAIMPLTRAADGSLGVRAVNSGVNNVQTASGSPQVYITIEGNGNTSVQTDGGMTEQFGKEIGSYVERRYRELMARDISPGGAVWNLAKGGR